MFSGQTRRSNSHIIWKMRYGKWKKNEKDDEYESKFLTALVYIIELRKSKITEAQK